MIHDGSTKKVEFGDFQTPLNTAHAICVRLRSLDICPNTVVEPTCGLGSFIVAALEAFSECQQVLGWDVNSQYVEQALSAIPSHVETNRVKIEKANFFEIDWRTLLARLPRPVLVLGNPPWVTNSGLGQINGTNLPKKTNDQRLKGLDALTGKSNFDISEWMLLRLLESLQDSGGTVAMLCKTSVARKILVFAQRNNLILSGAKIFILDSQAVFGASVDCCLFVFSVTDVRDYTCEFHQSLSEEKAHRLFGFVDGKMVADVRLYRETHTLDGVFSEKWRSGIKHDCAKVMELTRHGSLLINGYGETVDVESEFVYPLLKSSDLNQDDAPHSRKDVIITQRSVGAETESLRWRAPRLWGYLTSHRDAFERRKSSIYRGKPPFSIFGVGPYSFARWKVAVSGLYKTSRFSVLGPEDERTVMLDDTCYFIPVETESEAHRLGKLLASHESQNFLQSLIFWDAKRPINAEILQRLDLNRIISP